MALVHEFEKSGNWLFKRRSWLPVFFLVAGVVAMYFGNRQAILFDQRVEIGFLSVSILGELVRIITVGSEPRNTSGRNTVKGQVTDQLNVTGMYSQLRHPLYLGNFLMWLGPVLFLRSLVFVLFFVMAYWLCYERIIFAEEQFLRRKFGDAYDLWSEKVKAIIPRFSAYIRPSLPFSVRNVLKREYNSFVNIFLTFIILDLFRNYFLTERIFVTPMWLWTTIPAVIIWLAVWLIHKKTRLLEVEGR